MNIILYSANNEVLIRWKEMLLSVDSVLESFNDCTKLDTFQMLPDQQYVMLFHLSADEDNGSFLKSFQQRHKDQLLIIALSNTPDPVQGVGLLAYGIKGFANTYSAKENLLMAIDVVNKGELWLGEALINYILDYLKQNVSAGESEGDSEEDDASLSRNIFQKFTSREQQIAQKVLSGRQNKVIAEELCITERTVKAHLSAIYQKAMVKNRLELSLVLQKTNRRSGKKRVDRRKIAYPF